MGKRADRRLKYKNLTIKATPRTTAKSDDCQSCGEHITPDKEVNGNLTGQCVCANWKTKRGGYWRFAGTKF